MFSLALMDQRKKKTNGRDIGDLTDSIDTTHRERLFSLSIYLSIYLCSNNVFFHLFSFFYLIHGALQSFHIACVAGGVVAR